MGNYTQQQSSIQNSSFKEYARTFDNSTLPQVCLLGPGPISTYCTRRLAIMESGGTHSVDTYIAQVFYRHPRPERGSSATQTI